MKKYVLFILFCALSVSICAQSKIGNYKNFKVSVYTRAYEVRDMADQKRLDSTWNIISSQLKVDKIYLETHRDKLIVSDATLESAKKFFQGKGIEVVGGITYTIDESNHFETYCYTNPEHRQKVKEIAEVTAKHFDEFILDDFFFTSCKCDLCIKAKGAKSWTQYRLELMKKAAEELVIKPAKAVNPNVKVIIKYPNWYEHFQGLGFNLEAGPVQFDGIYTGTETRDPERSGQHLQQYESYLAYRYFHNIAPGKNGGGWVDPFGSFYLDRYAEQLWNTLFAKAPEITLFDYRSILNSIKPEQKGAWQGMQTSFDFDAMMYPYFNTDKTIVKTPTIALAAGYSFDQIDGFMGMLGKPIGVKSYKPFHSTGEDFLHNYFGMIGVPMDLMPDFPTGSEMILLTEAAKKDPLIVDKIKDCLKNGRNVMITSGLLRALQGKGIEDIVELNYSDRKAIVDRFVVGRNGYSNSEKKILIPQIEYLTNDSWEDVSAMDSGLGWPLIHQAMYSKASIFVLTVPENFADLYNLPKNVIDRMRNLLSQDLKVYLEGPSKISLYLYDNGTFIVESYADEVSSVKVNIKATNASLKELTNNLLYKGVNGKTPRVWGRATGEITSFDLSLKPHSFRVFQYK